MKPKSERPYIAGIDGLRAVAIISVLIYHTDKHLLPGGFAGVDVFFVISGFVVSMVTSQRHTSRLSELILTFYRNRVVRIMPAALTFIIAAQIAATLFIPITSKLTVTDMTAAAATVGVSNIILWQKAGDYFSPAAELNPFTHTWSLAVEEQFYFLFPFIAFMIWGSRTSTKVSQYGTSALLTLSLLSLMGASLFMASDATFSFYMLPARFWELSAGALLFLSISRHENKMKEWGGRHVWLLSLAGTLLLAASLFYLKPESFPVPGAIAPVLATCILIFVATTAPEAAISRLLSTSLMHYFGKISYSLYLWHWGVIVVMQWTIGLATPFQKVLAVLSSVILADLSYRLIETPTRTSAALAGQTSRNVILLAAASVATVSASVAALIVTRPALSFSVTRDQDIWQANTIKSSSCTPQRAKTNFASGFNYTFDPQGCSGAPISKALFIVGDSHAFAYQRLASNIASEERMHASIYTAPGCAALPNRTPDKDCDYFTRTALKAVVDHARSGDILFLPGLRTERYREYWEAAIRPYHPQTPYTNKAGMELQTILLELKPLLDKGIRIILEAPKPVYKFAPMRCSDWFNRINPHCAASPTSQAEQIERRKYMMSVMTELVRREARIEIWDPFPLLCPSLVCEPYRDGNPIVSDGDHLTGYANDYLSPYFRAAMDSRIGKVGA